MESAYQSVIAVLQIAAIQEFLPEDIPWKHAEPAAAPFRPPRILYICALLVVSYGYYGMSAAAYAGMLYYRLLLAA